MWRLRAQMHALTLQETPQPASYLVCAGINAMAILKLATGDGSCRAVAGVLLQKGFKLQAAVNLQRE